MSETSLPKQYDPSAVEPRWMQIWLSRGYFHADESRHIGALCDHAAAAQRDQARCIWVTRWATAFRTR